MITDLRINEKGELEGKVETPQWDETYYTKDDMVAMLTELQLEIEELRLDRSLMSRGGYECYGHEDKTPIEIQRECSDIIQQKIDALKKAVEV